MIKWIGVGLGTILGISHIGMIGYIATANKEQGLPKLDIPVTPYTSYVVEANKDGYKLKYTANDPKTAFIIKDPHLTYCARLRSPQPHSTHSGHE